MLTPPRASEHGFTLVEMIIAMFLLTIVLAGLSTFISSMWRNTSDTTARGRTQAQANDLMTTFGNDVRQAMHPSRGTGDITRTAIRALIVSTSPADKQPLGDIARATGDELWMWSDAIADPNGARECIGYVDDPDEGLVRSVFDDTSGCPATGDPIDSSVIASTRPDDRLDEPRFRYILNYNPSLFGDVALFDVEHCVTVRDVDIDSSPLPDLPSANRVVSIVGVQVDATTQEQDGEIQNGTNASYALTSRTTRPYQFGLGCAY